MELTWTHDLNFKKVLSLESQHFLNALVIAVLAKALDACGRNCQIKITNLYPLDSILSSRVMISGEGESHLNRVFTRLKKKKKSCQFSARIQNYITCGISKKYTRIILERMIKPTVLVIWLLPLKCLIVPLSFYVSLSLCLACRVAPILTEDTYYQCCSL